MTKAKYSMKDALALAEKMKDRKLRDKVVAMLKKPEAGNPEFVYPAAPFDRIPAWAVGAHHGYDGGELDHSVSVAKLALKLAEQFEEAYDIKINHDYLIAGALLHDIGKVFILKKEGGSWGFTGCQMDHADLGGQMLFAAGFPEEVVHIVASHGGDQGQAGAAPKTLEAMIVFHADVLDAAMESHVRPSAASLPLQFLLMPQEAEK
jgi:putative nucleotidyltransferase with HDIG domain